MLDLGETDFAWKIAKTALDAWKREVEYSHYTFEMFSIETGRGGWFHNFGGLSAPICLWAQAYFKPGTHQTGFDTFCTHGAFSEDCTAFFGQLYKLRGPKRHTAFVPAGKRDIPCVRQRRADESG